jgi:hypothetical protein
MVPYCVATCSRIQMGPCIHNNLWVTLHAVKRNIHDDTCELLHLIAKGFNMLERCQAIGREKPGAYECCASASGNVIK